MCSAFLDGFGPRARLQTLGVRLVAGYAILFVASTAVLAALAYLLFLHFMREPDRALMEAEAYELAAAYERGGAEALRSDLFSGAPDDRREEILVRFADPAGQTLLLYNPDNWKTDEVAYLEGLDIPDQEAWHELGPAGDDDPLEAFVVRLADGSTLQVGMDADVREDALESMREVFLAIALPVLVLALLGGALMAYRALQPIRQLARTLQAVIETGDVHTRVPVEEVRGEFAEIVHQFNRMLGRVEALVTGMRRTLDNIAHDLRTPMTRLRGRAELALQSERDGAAYREALAESVEASDTVITMLNAMMDVAEAEAGTMPLRLERLSVRELVRDVVELYTFVAEEKGIAITSDVPAQLEVVVDQSRMRQVLANLIDNAVKYTPRGGTVAVVAQRQDGEILVHVRDSGPGIPPDELPRIWDRLYRGDSSRTERGLGLGLSLVRAVVEAHGGRTSVESREGAGSTFTIRLPDRSNLTNL